MHNKSDVLQTQRLKARITSLTGSRLCGSLIGRTHAALMHLLVPNVLRPHQHRVAHVLTHPPALDNALNSEAPRMNPPPLL
jgi:hypothetical protein